MKDSNFGLKYPLVRNLLFVARESRTTSLMKFLSMKICFVRSCWTGLFAMLIADLLSQNNLTGVSTFSLNSSRTLLIQNTLQTPLAISLYSTCATSSNHILLFTLPSTQISPYVDLLSSPPDLHM